MPCAPQVIAVLLFLSTLPIEEYSLPDTVAAEPAKQATPDQRGRDGGRGRYN
jgi:hypothetical protein